MKINFLLKRFVLVSSILADHSCAAMGETNNMPTEIDLNGIFSLLWYYVFEFAIWRIVFIRLIVLFLHWRIFWTWEIDIVFHVITCLYHTIKRRIPNKSPPVYRENVFIFHIFIPSNWICLSHESSEFQNKSIGRVGLGRQK